MKILAGIESVKHTVAGRRCGGGRRRKGMDIFFNFRPMIMIQNENLLYIDKLIFNIETYAGAPTSAKNK